MDTYYTAQLRLYIAGRMVSMPTMGWPLRLFPIPRIDTPSLGSGIDTAILIVSGHRTPRSCHTQFQLYLIKFKFTPYLTTVLLSPHSPLLTTYVEHSQIQAHKLHQNPKPKISNNLSPTSSIPQNEENRLSAFILKIKN